MPVGCNGRNQQLFTLTVSQHVRRVPFFPPTVYSGAYFINDEQTLHWISQMSLTTGVPFRLLAKNINSLILEAEIPVNILTNRLTLLS